jgi:hypothetical protein
MNRQNLPGAWSSTGNALEVSSFHAKDTLFAIDDFAPQGSNADVPVITQPPIECSARLGIRRAGDGSTPRPPFAMQSRHARLFFQPGKRFHAGTRCARLLILEVSKGYISSKTLSACQEDARTGLYTKAMAGFLRWIAARYEDVRADLQRKIADRRNSPLLDAAHARTSEIIASLQAAFVINLQFAVFSGAVDVYEKQSLEERSLRAIQKAGSAQGKHQGETEPAAKFIAGIPSLLTSGRANLAARHGGRLNGRRNPAVGAKENLWAIASAG